MGAELYSIDKFVKTNHVREDISNALLELVIILKCIRYKISTCI